MSADNYNLILYDGARYYVYLNLGASEEIDPRKLISLAPDFIEYNKIDADRYADDDTNWAEYGTTYIDLKDLDEFERYEPPAEPKIIGTGPNSLVVEHYPTYRFLAEENHEPNWPLRIYNRTKRIQTIRGMFGWSTHIIEDDMPEKAVEDMIIYLPDEDHVKRVLSHLEWEHAMNTYGSYPENSWYVTNPQAVEEIVENVLNFQPEINDSQFAFDERLP